MDRVPHEVALVMETTAPSQEMATAIMAMAGHTGLHQAIPQWKGFTSNFAFPYSPKQIARGPVFRFNLNHIVEPASPYEMFPMETVQI